MKVFIEEILPPRFESYKRYTVSVNHQIDFKPFIYKRFEVEMKYDLLKFLGEGQYGFVCLARDKSNGHEVAIKKLEDIFRQRVHAQNVIRELLIHSQINHPFAVALEEIKRPVDQDTFDDIYFVMEKMKESLYTSLCHRENEGKRKRFVPLNVKLIMNQLLRGLQYLHAVNLLHRDLKPENILLNDKQRVKLCDFGFARIIAPRMTQMVVSMPYRPPELFVRQLSNQSNYGPAVDIWSLGCIFADMLLQRPMALGFGNGTTDIANLKSIAEKIPIPDDEEFSEIIDRYQARMFIKSQLPRTPLRPLRDIFRSVADKTAINLIERMLVFNPRKRISIADALQHEYMADITVDVLARELDLQPAEVEKLNDVNPPCIEMNVEIPSQSTKKDCRKIVFDAIANIQAGR